MNLTSKLFSLDKSIAGDLLKNYEFPWECLKDIGKYILEAALYFHMTLCR